MPEYPITDWIPTHATVDKQRYPQPGDLNPDVRVGVVSAKGGKVSWVHVPIEQGQDYIPRFGWVDRKTLVGGNAEQRPETPEDLFCRSGYGDGAQRAGDFR